MEKHKTENVVPKRETVDKMIFSIFVFTLLTFLLIFYMEYRSKNFVDENSSNSVQIQKLIEERDRLQEEIKRAKEQNQ